MMRKTRKTISITGLGEFHYTDKLLALVMQRTRADLYAEACERKLYGRSTLNKEQLAIAAVDAHLRELDAARYALFAEPKITCGRSWRDGDIYRTCDVVVTRDQVNRCGGGLDRHAVGPAHEGPCFDALRRVWDEAASALYPDVRTVTMICAKSFIGGGHRALCSVRQVPGARGNHEGPHYDEFLCVWDEAMSARYPDAPKVSRAKLEALRGELAALADRWQRPGVDPIVRMCGDTLRQILKDHK